MKKIFYCSAAVILALSALSCNRQVEVETPQPAVGSLTFRAVLEQPVTKADLSNYAVVWQAGDQIAVYNGSEWVTSDPLVASAIQNNGRYAEFSVSIAEAAGYWAVYPASAAPDAAISGDDIPVVLPAVQVIASGNSVAKDAIVQVCKTADKDNMVFKNVTSLVEFKAPEAVDGYVSFEAFGSDEAALPIAGTATVNADTPVAVSGDAGKVTVKGSFEAGENYFAVIYPQSAVSKFRFAFSKEDSSNGTLKAFRTGSAGTLEFPLNGGNKFSDLGTLNWLGPLSSKADLDKWAKYADYYLEGETIKLGADIDYEGGTWKPVNGNDATSFAGVLDGQNYSIFGLKFDYSSGPYCGFFSSLSSSSKRLRVKDLKLGYDAGSDTGYNDTNCILKVTTNNITVFGPLAGICNNCIINNTHNYVRTILDYVASSGTYCFGGLVGRTTGQCDFTDCSNHNIIACTSNGIDASTYIGGLIGEAGGTTTLSGCYNRGDIKRTQPATTTGSGIVLMGGIAGRVANDSKGHVWTSCANYGNLSFSKNIKSEKYFLGGITGCDGESPDESTNIIISNCSNEGTINCKNQANATDSGAGGIIGKISNNSQVLYCTNLGKLTKENHNKVEGRLGGIVGYLTNAQAVVDHCTNGDQLNSSKGEIVDADQTTNTNQRLGGIVGHANTGTISHCINYGPLNSSEDAPKMYVGGIAGNATLAKIVSCENYGTINVTGTGNTNSAGGIIGLQNGSKTENHTGENCIVKASITCGYSGNAGLVVGRYSNSVNTMWGTESSPIIIKSGSSINGITIDASNYQTYIAGTDYGITASGVVSTNGLNTIWATFE